MNTPQLTDAALRDIQAKLSDSGRTLKVRYIDKDPAKGLHGIRITNAAKLLEDVWSLQIFDRKTVSLAIGGFDNDHHVSLTGEDGEAFLEAIAEQIPRELWDIIPEGPATEEDAPGPINDAKVKLITYLVDKYPAQFGRYGTATNAPDFYSAVINLLATVDTDYRNRRDYDSIVEFESNARKGFEYTNHQLTAIAQAADENMRQEHRIEALRILYAANDAAAAAVNSRNRMSANGQAVPPAPTYPAVPTSVDRLRDEIIDVSLMQRDPIELPPDFATGTKTNDLNGGLDGRPLLTGPADTDRGAMVVVANGNTPQFRQMGTVIETFAEHATIQFHANGPAVPINYSDLVSM